MIVYLLLLCSKLHIIINPCHWTRIFVWLRLFIQIDRKTERARERESNRVREEIFESFGRRVHNNNNFVCANCAIQIRSLFLVWKWIEMSENAFTTYVHCTYQFNMPKRSRCANDINSKFIFGLKVLNIELLNLILLSANICQSDESNGHTTRFLNRYFCCFSILIC